MIQRVEGFSQEQGGIQASITLTKAPGFTTGLSLFRAGWFLVPWDGWQLYECKLQIPSESLT